MSSKSNSSGDRKSTTAKAGKRHGSVSYPSPASSDRVAGREQGEQQFVAKEPLSVTQEVTKIVFDEKIGQLVYRLKKVVSSAEFVFDPTRGRVVYSPSFKEKSTK